MGEQYLSTSRLGNVIRLIALGRQSGLLRVVRGQGTSREEGEVQFIDGQIAMATVGQLTGGAAVAVLQNWGESFYIFLDGVNRLQQTTTSNNLGWGNLNNSDSLPPGGSGSFPSSPSGGFSSSGSGAGGYGAPRSTSGSFGASGSGSGAFGGGAPGPSTSPGYGYGDYGSSPGGNTGYPSSHTNSRGFDSGSLPSQPYPTAVSPQVMQRLMDPNVILRRLTMTNPTEMAALDRRARQMLLLVDNHRTIADLMRLTRRSDDEIRTILAHLIALGLVE
jgi:hypothetical protein